MTGRNAVSHYRIIDPAPLLTPQRVSSLTDQVYRRVRQDIIEGRWPAAEVLLESELAAEFDVSKTPVREALRMLVQEEWLSVVPSRGYLVRPLGVRDISELYDVLLMIEPPLVAGFARSASAHDIATLRGHLDSQRDLLVEPHRSLDAARLFHLAAAGLARNHRAEVVVERALAEVRRLHHILPPHESRGAATAEVAAHEAILDAIARRRADEAAALMRGHLSLSASAIASSFATAKIGKYIAGSLAEASPASAFFSRRQEKNMPQDLRFDADGVQIAYDEEGVGDPIVMLHGFGGTAKASWMDTGIFDDLARDFRVIAYDARGHGRSSKPHGASAYGRELGIDVIRLLDHLGLERAHLLGMSMGAHTAMHVVAIAPDRVASATLAGAAGRFEWTDEDRARIRLEAEEIENGSVRAMMLRLWPLGEPRPSDEEIDAMSARMLTGKDVVALAAVRRSLDAQIVVAAQVARIEVPVLGIVGTRDPYYEQFQALKRAMPQLRLVEIEGATHGTTYTDPEFLPAVREHLAAVGALGV